jgi:hypothetical protein
VREGRKATGLSEFITGEAGIASRREAAAIMAKGVAELGRLAGETSE